MDARFSSQPPIYPSGYPPTSRQPPPPTSYTHSHQLPQPPLSAPNTLPPPQPTQNYGYSFPNDPTGQRPQVAQPSYNPVTTNASNSNGSFPVYAPTAATHFQAHPQSYSQSTRSFSSPSTYAPQIPTSQAYQAYSASNGTHGLPSLLPMPNGAVPPQASYFQQSPTASALPQYEQQQGQQQQQPTHVVGSQGRRGILPSAAGRPAAVATGTADTQKSATTPTKDAEGKFPCEHCSKNYLHAKHLKRHLLRHTGVRPYSCGLCKDTFSRSDILKRHFQKCSVRRGNPTGANHLSHSRANNKKAKGNQVEQLSIPMANASATESSMTPLQPTQPTSHKAASTPTLQSPFGLEGMNNLGLGTATYHEELQNISNQPSRANSIKRTSNGIGTNSRTTSGPSSVGAADSAFSYSNGRVSPDSLTTSGAATPYSLHHDGRLAFSPDGTYNGSGGSGLDLNSISRPHSGPNYTSGNHPLIIGAGNGSKHDLNEFSHLLSTNGHDDFNQQYPSHTHDTHYNVKSEPDLSHIPYSMNGSYSNYSHKG